MTNSGWPIVSEPGAAMLGMMPPFHTEDPHIVGIVDSLGREAANAETAIEATSLLFFPMRMKDPAHFAIWEYALDLPTDPAIPLHNRRNAIINRMRSFATAGAGYNWVNAVSALVDSWSYEENEPDGYMIRIRTGYDSDSVQARQLIELVRSITPAHLDVVYEFGDGFILGASQLSVDTL